MATKKNSDKIIVKEEQKNWHIFEHDTLLRQSGIELICGVDEAGRGPLAGPVFAAAVVLPDDFYTPLLNDSKKVSEKKRDELFDLIIEKALYYNISASDEAEIDEINILNATMLAMTRAVTGLSVVPTLCLIDGNKVPDNLPCQGQDLVKGDGKSASIAAASILAKVSRDRYMLALAEKYPEYCFEKHKGYGTKLHYEMLEKHGVSDIHRKTFLKKIINK